MNPTVRGPAAATSPAARRWIEATTIGDLLDRRAAVAASSQAVVFPDERATFGELADRAQTFARGLIALGVERGDRVGMFLPNSIDQLAMIFAAAKVGAVATPVNTRLKAVEIGHIIRHSGMRVLVSRTPRPGASDHVAVVSAAIGETDHWQHGDLNVAELPELRRVVVLDDARTGAAFAAAAGEIPDQEVAARQQAVRIRDTGALVYTSGTTSAPKAARLSHEALTRLAGGITSAIPLFHGGGITFALTCVHAGATFVHAGQFNARQAMHALADEQITVAIAAFETIWLPVLNQPDFAEQDLSRLRLVELVGVAERIRAMAARLPHAIHISTVAMTESTAFLSLGRPDDDPDKLLTTGGHLMPGMQARIVDPGTGADLPRDTPGELLFQGPNAFDGYFRDPEATAAAIDHDGWVHTGDLVTCDEDGRLTFISRLKDMLKVGGENVAAAEVEGHLLRHPAVGIVQVVAAPDAYYGEVPAAFVELRPGMTLTEDELITFCLGHIATYRVPRYVRFVDEWPMSGTKIQKFVLRKRIRDELLARGITEAPRLRAASPTASMS
jgi:fatty-acyl-CoA synthase